MSLSEPLRYQPDNADFGAMLAHFRLLEPVFDALPDVAFFVKDAGGRYAIVNRTLAMRCGYKDKRDLLGKTADEVFPRRFGRSYFEQDMATINAGQQLVDQLELHLYPGRQPGWCLTCSRCATPRAGWSASRASRAT